MFGSLELGGDRSATVAELRRRLDAMGAAGRVIRSPAGAYPQGPTLAAPGPIAAVLPAGGLPRGSVVSVGSAAPGRSGGTSLLLALLAAPREVWCAAVGLPRLGLLAAAEMGVDLARLGIIPDPGPDPLQVVSVLADGVDVIAMASPLGMSGGLPPARQRVIAGRLREGGAVLLVAGRWPGADLAMTVQGVRWSGIGAGYGRLRDRELDVHIGGRRAGAASGAVVTLELRAGKGSVTVGAADRTSAGAAWTGSGARADVG